MKNPKVLENQHEKDEKIIKLIRILTRGTGPILFLVMLTLAIGQGGMDRLINLTLEETIIIVGIMCMFFGIVWAYQNEIAGGIIIVLAYVIVAILQGKIFPNSVMPIFLIIGILNIYLGLMEIGLKKRRKI